MKKLNLKQRADNVLKCSPSEFAPLSFNEIMEGLYWIVKREKDHKWYKKNPKILASELQFFAHELSLLTNL